MATISIREYARRKGCSDTAVHKAIRAEKIVKGLEHDEKGRPRINPEIADAEWSVHFDHIEPKNKTLAANIPKPPDIEEPAPGGGIQGSLAKAKLSQTVSKAKLLDLEFRYKTGKLVERDKVYSALFNAGQEVRAALQTIPDRHIDEILSATSRNEAHAILYNALSESLGILADIQKREISPRRT